MLYLIAVLIVVVFVGSRLLFPAIVRFPRLSDMMGSDIGPVIVLLLDIPVVFLFSRLALRLLHSTERTIPSIVDRLAALVGVAAVVMQFAITLIVNHVIPVILFQPTTAIASLVRQLVLSLIGASPFVPLFVALSLLAADDEWQGASSGSQAVDAS